MTAPDAHPIDDGELLRLASEVRSRARAVYSGFRVGAALRTRSGRTYLGCNVESATFGLTLCAERVALFSALADGEGEFEAVAIVVPDGQRAVPCGMCRQALLEFAPRVRLILANGDGGHRISSLEALMPVGPPRRRPAPGREGEGVE